MKDILFALRRPRTVDWYNPFRGYTYRIAVGIIVACLVLHWDIVLSSNPYLFFIALAIIAAITCFASSMFDNHRKGYPLWAKFFGTPVQMNILDHGRVARAEDWLRENIPSSRWTIDVHLKERLLWSKYRTLNDLAYIGDSVYLVFHQRNDAILFKLYFG